MTAAELVTHPIAGVVSAAVTAASIAATALGHAAVRPARDPGRAEVQCVDRPARRSRSWLRGRRRRRPTLSADAAARWLDHVGRATRTGASLREAAVDIDGPAGGLGAAHDPF